MEDKQQHGTKSNAADEETTKMTAPGQTKPDTDIDENVARENEYDAFNRQATSRPQQKETK